MIFSRATWKIHVIHKTYRSAEVSDAAQNGVSRLTTNAPSALMSPSADAQRHLRAQPAARRSHSRVSQTRQLGVTYQRCYRAAGSRERGQSSSVEIPFCDTFRLHTGITCVCCCWPNAGTRAGEKESERAGSERSEHCPSRASLPTSAGGCHTPSAFIVVVRARSAGADGKFRPSSLSCDETNRQRRARRYEPHGRRGNTAKCRLRSQL